MEKEIKKMSKETRKLKNTKKIIFILIAGIAIVSFIITLIAIIQINNNHSNQTANSKSDYLLSYIKQNPVNESAKNISYTIQKSVLSNFSVDLSKKQIISNQLLDTNDDQEKELIQISLLQERDIYPQITIINDNNVDKNDNISNLEFKKDNYHISADCPGMYYFYYSKRYNTIVIVSESELIDYSTQRSIIIKNLQGKTLSNCNYTRNGNEKIEFKNYLDHNSNNDLYIYDVNDISPEYSGESLRITIRSIELANTISNDSNGGKDYLITNKKLSEIIADDKDIILLGKLEVNVDNNNGKLTYIDLAQ